ncbi:MAG: hypothetical protein GY701_30820 [Sulfitobacter sp.]|nr:hypothetical protein [Sulfitobacter sp.]
MTVYAVYGRHSVRVEADDGERFILPVAWTNLRPRSAPLQWEGRSVVLAPSTLLAVDAWVAARSREEVEEFAADDDLGDNPDDEGGRTRGDASPDALVGQADPSASHRRARGSQRGVR